MQNTDKQAPPTPDVVNSIVIHDIKSIQNHPTERLEREVHDLREVAELGII